MVRKKNKKNKILLYSIIGLLLIAAIVIIILTVNNNSQKSETDKSTEKKDEEPSKNTDQIVSSGSACGNDQYYDYNTSHCKTKIAAGSSCQNGVSCASGVCVLGSDGSGKCGGDKLSKNCIEIDPTDNNKCKKCYNLTLNTKGQCCPVNCLDCDRDGNCKDGQCASGKYLDNNKCKKGKSRSDLESEITAKDNEITAKNNEITAKNNEITAKNNEITAKDNQILTQNTQISTLTNTKEQVCLVIQPSTDNCQLCDRSHNTEFNECYDIIETYNDLANLVASRCNGGIEIDQDSSPYIFAQLIKEGVQKTGSTFMFYYYKGISGYDAPEGPLKISDDITMTNPLTTKQITDMSNDKTRSKWEITNKKNFGPIKTWKFGPVIKTLTGIFSGNFFGWQKKKFFNLDISGWDVRHVEDMSGLFRDFQSFNQQLNKWDVSNVTDMSYMFYGAGFDQQLNKWNTSNVTDMSYMFNGAAFFNQNINTKTVTLDDGTTYTAWDVSNVTTMRAMFSDTLNFPLRDQHYKKILGRFDQPLDKWNTSNVTDMSMMFYRAKDFNHNINTNTVTLDDGTTYTAWDVSNVKAMRAMFDDAINFNQPLNNWNTSNVTDMGSIFSGATKFNQDISNWNINKLRSNLRYYHFPTGFPDSKKPKKSTS